MALPYRHVCERCGMEALLERTGRFRDADYVELHHEYLALEQEHNRLAAELHLAQTRLQAAYERIEQLRELVDELPDPEPLELPEVAECPF